MTSRPRKRGALKGARRVKRLLKRLPDEVSAEMVDVLNAQAPFIAGYAREAAPRRSGKLASAIKWKVLPKSLSLRVGLLTRAVARDLFYGRILEFGRRAQTVTAKRAKPNGGFTTYRIRVPAISRARYDFLAGRAMTFATQRLRPELSKVWERALRRAGSGGSDE